ncbi:hypothetical protein, partial [Psychrobacter sp. TWR1-1-1]|uniref:hypothetical protein n=1 Tax=Psychrobacter sp. TWR1-1-1 TaxID=2804665 RepID=UPI003CED44D7
ISLQPRAPEYGQWRFYANAETKPRSLILFDKCLMVGMITLPQPKKIIQKPDTKKPSHYDWAFLF